jgi:mono/diheme cytochrome c family protein
MSGVAAFFLRRQLIRMPAFGDRVSEEEVRGIAEYIRWLRHPTAPSESAPP